MKRSLILVILFLLAQICISQETFEKIYPLDQGYNGLCAVQTFDSGFVLLADCLSSGYHFLLIKTNSKGDTLWTKNLNYSIPTYNSLLIQMPDSGFIICAYKSNIITLIRTNPTGDTLWTNALVEGTGNFIKKTSDNGFLIGGNSGDGKSLLIKTDSKGTIQWQKRYTFGSASNSTLGSEPISVIENNDHSFTMCGNCCYNPYDMITKGFYILQLTATGDSITSKIHQGRYPSSMHVYSMDTTPDHGMILSGMVDKTGAMSESFGMVFKTTAKGDSLWSRSYLTIPAPFSSGIVLANGDIVEAGGYKKENVYKGYMVKLNSNGDSIWTRTFFNDTVYCFLNSVVMTSDGGFLSAGDNFGTNSNIILVKTDANGTIFPEGINNHQPGLSLYPFPNPTHGKIYITPPDKFNTLEISDILGNVILLKELDPNSNNTISIDLSGNSTGIYLLKLKNENNVLTAKIVME